MKFRKFDPVAEISEIGLDIWSIEANWAISQNCRKSQISNWLRNLGNFGNLGNSGNLTKLPKFLRSAWQFGQFGRFDHPAPQVAETSNLLENLGKFSVSKFLSSLEIDATSAL